MKFYSLELLPWNFRKITKWSPGVTKGHLLENYVMTVSHWMTHVETFIWFSLVRNPNRKSKSGFCRFLVWNWSHPTTSIMPSMMILLLLTMHNRFFGGVVSYPTILFWDTLDIGYIVFKIKSRHIPPGRGETRVRFSLGPKLESQNR